MYGVNCQEVDLQFVGRLCLSMIEATLKSLVSAQHVHNGNVFNLMFESFEKDNAEWIERVRKFLGVVNSKEMSERVDVFLSERTRYKRGRVRYCPTTFGYNMNDIRMKFSFYTEFQRQLTSHETKS